MCTPVWPSSRATVKVETGAPLSSVCSRAVAYPWRSLFQRTSSGWKLALLPSLSSSRGSVAPPPVTVAAGGYSFMSRACVRHERGMRRICTSPWTVDTRTLCCRHPVDRECLVAVPRLVAHSGDSVMDSGKSLRMRGAARPCTYEPSNSSSPPTPGGGGITSSRRPRRSRQGRRPARLRGSPRCPRRCSRAPSLRATRSPRRPARWWRSPGLWRGRSRWRAGPERTFDHGRGPSPGATGTIPPSR